MLPQSEGGGTGHAFPVILKSQNREGKLQLVAECTDRAYFDADAAGAAALLLGLPRCGSGRRSLLGPPRRAASPASPSCSISFRSEEHTSELQSLMRISYAVFCLKKKKTSNQNTTQLNYSIILNRQTMLMESHNAHKRHIQK